MRRQGREPERDLRSKTGGKRDQQVRATQGSSTHSIPEPPLLKYGSGLQHQLWSSYQSAVWPAKGPPAG